MNKNIIRHGEVILKPISELPKEVKLQEESKKYIVAHSETGHHHVLEAKKEFKIYKTDLGEMYLEIPESAELWHQKTGKDVHTPHKVVPAFYKVIIKKSFDYFKGLMSRVRD
jgi:hypothetical protein